MEKSVIRVPARMRRKSAPGGGEICDVVGLETEALRERLGAELEVAEVKMLKFS